MHQAQAKYLNDSFKKEYDISFVDIQAEPCSGSFLPEDCSGTIDDEMGTMIMESDDIKLECENDIKPDIFAEVADANMGCFDQGITNNTANDEMMTENDDNNPSQRKDSNRRGRRTFSCEICQTVIWTKRNLEVSYQRAPINYYILEYFPNRFLFFIVESYDASCGKYLPILPYQVNKTLGFQLIKTKFGTRNHA